MRIPVLRSVAVAIPVALASLAGASGAAAHGGTTLAEGGTGGVTVLLQAAETTTQTGKPAVDLSTVLNGPGTGSKATVTLWIRPSGGKTFKVTTDRDAQGVAHQDVATAGRGSWRDWDVSAVVALSSGKRLRVSNAEANPPGPEPAATAGGGASGADGDEASADPGTTTDAGGASAGGTSGGVAPGAGAADDDTTADADGAGADGTGGESADSAEGGEASAADGTSGAAAEELTDVTGESDGAPGWVLPSAIVIALAAVVFVVVRRRRAS
ncbi:hypothetical protein [Patulibacter americanus]|uniref:hypothetical protein n=1 Tax=Patulibacter americanus TaxID=588672 RepID=UPI0003B7010D|nr:hypothetical protein [Patulibacter americanus]